MNGDVRGWPVPSPTGQGFRTPAALPATAVRRRLSREEYHTTPRSNQLKCALVVGNALVSESECAWRTKTNPTVPMVTHKLAAASGTTLRSRPNCEKFHTAP